MSESAPGDRSISSVVEVAVDPSTAFSVFTEELDLWWVRGPINHHAGGRALAMRCEPGVGGRLLEVYNDTTGDALELARITAWEPGKRLVFTWRQSSFAPEQSTEVEVSFAAVGAETRISVEHRAWDTIPRRHVARHGFPEPTTLRHVAGWWRASLEALARLLATARPPT